VVWTLVGNITLGSGSMDNEGVRWDWTLEDFKYSPLFAQKNQAQLSIWEMAIPSWVVILPDFTTYWDFNESVLMQIKTNPFGIGKLVRQWAAFFFACLQA
jgi:hypothetical protein